MRQLVQKYASVIRFIFTFLGSYLLLALLYNIYLQNFDSASWYPDPLTHLVAIQSETVVDALGYESWLRSGYPEATMHLLIKDQFVARIIEGCNAASITILFVSFMLAFYGKTRPTILYTFAGIVIIYVTNILRIALMAIGIYEYPHQAHFLHSIAFPLVIYGTVFLLWVLWIAIYAKQIRA